MLEIECLIVGSNKKSECKPLYRHSWSEWSKKRLNVSVTNKKGQQNVQIWCDEFHSCWNLTKTFSVKFYPSCRELTRART